MNDSGKRIDYGEGCAMREPDEGKGRPDLISPWALTRLARWYELGSTKYPENDGRNWERGMPFSRYTASLFRHLIAWMKKEKNEDHLAAIVWNTFAPMHHQELGEDTKWDDMPDRSNTVASNKLTIAVDCDDVLLDLVPRWVEILNCRHGTSVSPDDITDWNISKFFPLDVSVVYAPLYEDEFWQSIEPCKGAIHFIGNMTERGHDVIVVTNTDYRNVKAKVEVLTKWFPTISCDDVIITSSKQIVKCDVLIDDNPTNLVGGDYYKVLVDKPHNRKFSTGDNKVKRIFSLIEAEKEINRLLIERLR